MVVFGRIITLSEAEIYYLDILEVVPASTDGLLGQCQFIEFEREEAGAVRTGDEDLPAGIRERPNFHDGDRAQPNGCSLMVTVRCMHNVSHRIVSENELPLSHFRCHIHANPVPALTPTETRQLLPDLVRFPGP
jgi:hypothetical protein